MSVETYGLFVLTILSAISVALSGIVCRKAGYEFGMRKGIKMGHRDGWHDAHERMADAINVSPEALNCALLHREIEADGPASEESKYRREDGNLRLWR